MGLRPTLASLVVKVEVIQGKDLVAKDKSLFAKNKTSDPYIKVFGGTTPLGRTKTFPKTLNPVWNETFELTLGADAANHVVNGTGPGVTLQFQIYDEDKIGDDDPMGVVLVPLRPLQPSSTDWYPVTQGSGTCFCKKATGQLQIKLHVTAQQMKDVVRGNVQPLNYSRIQVLLSWDVEKGQMIDLDSSCVAVDGQGSILLDETVYYGNLVNSNNSLIHSGDETKGKIGSDGGDEKITCELDRVPSRVIALYFILTVATPEKTFADVKSAQVRFLSINNKLGICRFVPHEFGPKTAMFLVRLSRDGNRWIMAPIEGNDSFARDFGSLIPEIKGYTRDLVPGIVINPQERIAIMRKGGTIRVSDYIPGHVLPKWLTFGLAWDVTNGVNIDLDASAILLDKDLRPLEIVFFRQLVSKDGAIRHCGDEREGDEAGDDERINFSFGSIHAKVQYIGLVISSFSGQELDDVAKAKCHIFDPTTKVEIAQYTLSHSPALDKHTALVMGCLYRDGDSWNFRIISEAAQGKTAHDNVDELQNFLRNNPPQTPSMHPEPDIILNEMPDPIPTNDEDIILSVEDMKHYPSR